MSRLAYVPPPLDDEPLDGWVDRIAHGLACTRPQLLNMVGVDGYHETVVKHPTSETLRCLSAATGVPVARLVEMTAERWRPIGLTPHPANERRSEGRLGPNDVHRYCPACWTERGGARRQCWNLHVVFACVEHRTCLVPVPPPQARHGYELGGVIGGPPPVPLPPHHPLLTTQARIDDLIANPTQLVPSLGSWRPVWELLADVGTLIRMSTGSPALDDPRGFVADYEAESGTRWACDLTFPQTLPGDPMSRLVTVFDSPALSGVLIHAALAVLDQPTPCDAYDALWWLTEEACRDAASHAKGRRLSWHLTEVMRSGQPASRARYHHLARFDLAKDPTEGTPLVPLDSAQVPANIWGTVIPSTTTARDDIERLAAATALLTFGIGSDAKGALTRLGHGYLIEHVHRDWERAFTGPDADTVFAGYLALHQQLTTVTVPIDYDRRRHTWGAPAPFGRNTAKRVTRELNQRATPRVLAFSSWYVWELLTGSNALLQSDGLEIHGAWRHWYRQQRHTWRLEEPPILPLLAEEALYRHRINEPLTWEPIRTDTGWETTATGRPHTLNGWNTTKRVMRGPAVRRQPLPNYTFTAAARHALTSNGPTAALIAERLRTFETVLQAQSFAEAATRLGTRASVVSTHIRDLENIVGAHLFNRTQTGAHPTAEAHRLWRSINSARKGGAHGEPVNEALATFAALDGETP